MPEANCACSTAARIAWTVFVDVYHDPAVQAVTGCFANTEDIHLIVSGDGGYYGAHLGGADVKSNYDSLFHVCLLFDDVVAEIPAGLTEPAGL